MSGERAMGIVLSTRLPERLPHLCASRPSAIDATTHSDMSQHCQSKLAQSHPHEALGLTAFLLDFT
jgi:hypothetical protein